MSDDFDVRRNVRLLDRTFDTGPMVRAGDIDHDVSLLHLVDDKLGVLESSFNWGQTRVNLAQSRLPGSSEAPDDRVHWVCWVISSK